MPFLIIILILGAAIFIPVVLNKTINKLRNHPNFFLRNISAPFLLILYGGYFFYEGSLYAPYPSKSSCGAVDIRIDLFLIIPVLIVITNILLSTYIKRFATRLILSILITLIAVYFSLNFACQIYFSIR